ncbi:hypothetical protein [Sphingopyxis sp. PET50]|uniref:hypothetical protein n=1 Tax=Sphingopyxis sp. PET50 TaxID=2976533 RepID=UPI0021B033A5|nr:hypothetical protein [Sphingopyxis sp. PET50]
MYRRSRHDHFPRADAVRIAAIRSGASDLAARWSVEDAAPMPASPPRSMPQRGSIPKRLSRGWGPGSTIRAGSASGSDRRSPCSPPIPLRGRRSASSAGAAGPAG